MQIYNRISLVMPIICVMRANAKNIFSFRQSGIDFSVMGEVRARIIFSTVPTLEYMRLNGFENVISIVRIEQHFK